MAYAWEINLEAIVHNSYNLCFYKFASNASQTLSRKQDNKFILDVFVVSLFGEYRKAIYCNTES